MTTDTRQHMSFSIRLRFGLRLLGITGVLTALAGALYLSSFLTEWSVDAVLGAAQGRLGGPATVGALVLGIGAILALVAVVGEVLNALVSGSSQRGAAEANAFAQIVLAVAVLAAVNVYAFQHEADFDLTRGKQFTLPARVVDELQKLKSETTIVVLQQHKTFGRLSEKPDRFDYAAERKVVEKVQDMVDLFGKFGSQFKVVVLDVEEDSYDKKLNELTEKNEKLKAAIQSAPENSIFFASEGKVQRMSFNEFYQLDKHASKEDGHKGNLVLYPQGIESLVQRITAIEEKRPKVAVAVTHPYLSTRMKKGSGLESLTLQGLRSSLTEYGFDVVDIVLKKNYRGDYEGDPASFTGQESQLNELEDKLEVERLDLKRERAIGERLAGALKKLEQAKEKPVLQRIDLYLGAIFDMRRQRVAVRPEVRQDEQAGEGFEADVLNLYDVLDKEHKQDLADAEEDVKQTEKELAEVGKQERAIEDRYLTDVEAKLTRQLADCDLLIISRLTLVNPAKGHVLPRNLHKLDAQQAKVIKEFMKAGKPVLLCSGSVNIPSTEQLPESFDDVEKLLKDRGVHLFRQTVLFNVESKSFRESTSEEDELSDTTVEVPPLQFVPPIEFNRDGLKPNPIARAMEVLQNSTDQPLDIKVRAPRPVSLSEAAQKAQGFAAEFLWTSPRSWSERYPFNFMMRMQQNPFNMQPMRVRVPTTRPRLDTSPSDQPKFGLLDEEDEHRGPIGIAVSAESIPPESWYKSPTEERKPGRLAVIGHGGIFTEPKLNAATEKLLLVTCNWLLGRDERLPHVADAAAATALDRPWKYPRVEMSDSRKGLWHWGAFLGLPALFVYLGVIVLMIRQVR